MNILLQPCSGKSPMGHFDDTVVNGVPLSYFDGKIDKNEFDKLKELKTSTIKAWGFVPNAKVKEWTKLKEGDLVLFYANRGFFYLATVFTKIHNKNIAESLWGTDEKGRTWEYMFFIKDGKSIQLIFTPEVLLKNDLTNYASNYIVQGALLLMDKNADIMKKYIEENEGSDFNEDSIEPTEEEEVSFYEKIKEPNNPEEAIAEIVRISEEIKNDPVKERIKVARMLVRNPKFARLVKEKAKYICEICGEGPFMQKNGLPYAEAHHKSELSKTRIDNPNDMICVCANCHKVIHFGVIEELQKRLNKKSHV